LQAKSSLHEVLPRGSLRRKLAQANVRQKARCAAGLPGPPMMDRGRPTS
jgi:hypothetical protein